MLNTSAPKISIIVPVYNVKEYLHRCIDSILVQSYTNFELLLIDDGSPDNCGQICDEYAAKDSRVRVFHKENGGVSSARNLGLDNASGEWIAFVDSDDYVDVDYLAELVAYTTLDNVDFVVTLNTISNYTKDNHIVLNHDDLILFSLYKFQDYGQPWGKLFRNEIIKKFSLRYNSQVHIVEDFIFVLYYLQEIDDIVLLTSDKYYYERDRQDSLTKRINSFESELVGKEEFEKIAQSYIFRNASYEKEMSNTSSFLTERTIIAIMNLSDVEVRLRELRRLNLSVFLRNRKPLCLKEFLLLTLLKLRLFYQYDYLYHIIYKK